MPRIFFDFSDGENVVTGAVGKEFASEDEAIETAILALKRSFELGIELSKTRVYRMSIRNEARVVIFETVVRASDQSSH